jgi:esterase/lipase
MVIEKAKEINLKSNSKKEFLLFHGYTGSPTDFNFLGRYLQKNLNANVRIIRLKGHGTKVEDLDNLTYEDFLEQAEGELKKDLKKGREIVVGGFSFGGIIALDVASKYPVKGVFNIVTPYEFKWYFNLPLVFLLARVKKYWKKYINEEEERSRKNDFRYDYMHSNGVSVIGDGRKNLKKNLTKITCPCLTIHSTNDTFATKRTGESINQSVNSKVKKILLINTSSHNLFFSNKEKILNEEIYKFFRKILN